VVYYEKRDLMLERMRLYRKENPDVMKSSDERWRKNNPDKVRAMKNAGWHRRRSKELEKPVIWSIKIKKEILSFWGEKCVYCNGKYEHMDHYIPISWDNNPGTVPWNMVPACQHCNLTKNDKDPYMFINDLHTISKIESGLWDFKEKYGHNYSCK